MTNSTPKPSPALAIVACLAAAASPSATAQGPTEGQPGPVVHCVGAARTASAWCANDVRAFSEKGQPIRRFRLRQTVQHRLPPQEYLVWHDCGTTAFRMLARRPERLPPLRRWIEFDIDEMGGERARQLREIGTWACSLADD